MLVASSELAGGQRGLGIHSPLVFGQGPGVLSMCPVGEVEADSMEQARASGIMRFSQPHDHGGSPCLPTHHPRSPTPWPSSPTPTPSKTGNPRTCPPTPPPRARPPPAGPPQDSDPPPLPASLATIHAPRRASGRRHPLVAIL